MISLKKVPRGTIVGLLALAMFAPSSVGGTVKINTVPLQDAVTVKAVRLHQLVFQKIANARRSNDTRASGTPGYDLSVAYVAKVAEAAGYKVTIQPFLFPYFEELAASELEQTDTDPDVVYGPNDFLTMTYSGSGDVTAATQPVDLVLPPGPAGSSTSGCEAADFASFVAGNIAVIQRGTCTFGEKAAFAEAAGASGVIIFNEGQPGRTDVLAGATLGGPAATIPVVFTSFAVGSDLAAAGVSARIFVSAISENRETANVIADSRGGKADRVVVVGAHLDSVAEGPGINDNGSGSGAILEIARQISKLGIKPRNKLRFAWWGAEEAGLLGSQFYVGGLSEAAIAKIALNLNFDMIGSPNYVRFVYDGDGSDTPAPGPAGSDVIEAVFLNYFDDQGLPTEPTAFDGRSDYGPFIDVGIPAGGLFTGAEELKTAEQAAIYGGTAGVALDPCYHQACDNFRNNSNRALNQMSDAAAHAVLTFAMTTARVGGTATALGNRTSQADMTFLGHNAQK